MTLRVLFKDRRKLVAKVQFVSNCSTESGRDLLLYVLVGHVNIPENRMSIPMSEILCVEVTDCGNMDI